MRKIIMFNRVSADGYFSGPDGELDWAVPDDELDREAVDSLPDADTILFGRRTYQAFEGFWPHVLDRGEAAPDPHAQQRSSPALRAMALWIDAATKLVFSTGLKQPAWRNTRVLRQLDAREIEALKRKPGKDIMLFGSASLASQLLAHGLVDELRQVISPLLLGRGNLLVQADVGRAALVLEEAKATASGNVRLRYHVRN